MIKKQYKLIKTLFSFIIFSAIFLFACDSKRIKVDENTRFFNKNGKPVLYYYQKGSDIEFFKRRGYHPQYGVELMPVTKEIVEEYFSGIETKTAPNTRRRSYPSRYSR